MALDITKENFEKEILQSKTPALVDFWASWCGPCKMVAPVVEELSKEYAGKVKVCKVNVDNAPELASQLGIMSIPTFIVFSKGEEQARKVGALSKKELMDSITPYIGA
jgi:thioredoxin 1